MQTGMPGTLQHHAPSSEPIAASHLELMEVYSLAYVACMIGFLLFKMRCGSALLLHLPGRVLHFTAWA